MGSIQKKSNPLQNFPNEGSAEIDDPLNYAFIEFDEDRRHRNLLLRLLLSILMIKLLFHPRIDLCYLNLTALLLLLPYSNQATSRFITVQGNRQIQRLLPYYIFTLCQGKCIKDNVMVMLLEFHHYTSNLFKIHNYL